MRNLFSSIRARLSRIVALVFLVAAPAFAADASFDPTTGVVTIPSVQVGGSKYVNVTLKQIAGSYTFTLQGASAGTFAGTASATYDLNTKVLTLPVVRLGQSSYRVLLQDVGNFTFNLTSASIAETYTFYSRNQPGVAQTATLINGALFMDGIAISQFLFGETAVDGSDTLQSWTSPWNNSPNQQPTVQTMLFCAADGKLSYVVVKDAAQDPQRTTSTAVDLVTAIHAAPQREGVGIYTDCSGLATKGWLNNLPADTFLLYPNQFTTYPYTTLLGQLDGSVIYRQSGTVSTQHNFIGITWKGTSTFEVWQ